MHTLDEDSDELNLTNEDENGAQQQPLNFTRLSNQYSQNNNELNDSDEDAEGEENDFIVDNNKMEEYTKRQSINLELNMSNLSNEKKIGGLNLSGNGKGDESQGNIQASGKSNNR